MLAFHRQILKSSPMTQTDARTAILDQLRALKAEDGRPIEIYDIGVPLIGLGYDQHEIANALYGLDRDGQIALIGGNRLKALKLV